MSRRLIILTAALLANAATLAAQGAAPARPQSPDQEAPNPFRVSVDVVAVDVQAIDRDGKPVPDLGPEKFSVTINGRRRRVVSAERIGIDDRESGRPSGGAGASAYLERARDRHRGRLRELRRDGVARRDSGRAQFVGQLSPDDYVGLSAYRTAPRSIRRRIVRAVLEALDRVVGQRISRR